MIHYSEAQKEMYQKASLPVGSIGSSLPAPLPWDNCWHCLWKESLPSNALRLQVNQNWSWAATYDNLKKLAPVLQRLTEMNSGPAFWVQMSH